MKTILFISAFTPSRFTAGQNYTYNLLEDLSKRYKIHLVYFKFRNQTYLPVNENITLMKEFDLTWLGRIINFICFPVFHPTISSRFSIFSLLFLRSLIKKNKYEVIYFDFTQIFLFSLFLKANSRILMAHDLWCQKYKREGSPLTTCWIYYNERLLLRQSGVTISTFSKKDKRLIKTLYQINSQVVNFYLSPQILNLTPNDIQITSGFCFYAAWNRTENSKGLEWFLRNVFPYVDGKNYIIIGKDLPMHLIEFISKKSTIKYIGFVENPYPIISSSAALLAPLFKGAGVKVKVIESLACGTPVIGTKVALEGIEFYDDALIECNDAKEFITAIQTFSSSVDRKLKIRKLFLDTYSKQPKSIL